MSAPNDVSRHAPAAGWVTILVFSLFAWTMSNLD
jgi:hypothetical protein